MRRLAALLPTAARAAARTASRLLCLRRRRRSHRAAPTPAPSPSRTARAAAAPPRLPAATAPRAARAPHAPRAPPACSLDLPAPPERADDALAVPKLSIIRAAEGAEVSCLELQLSSERTIFQKRECDRRLELQARAVAAPRPVESRPARPAGWNWGKTFFRGQPGARGGAGEAPALAREAAVEGGGGAGLMQRLGGMGEMMPLAQSTRNLLSSVLGGDASSPGEPRDGAPAVPQLPAASPAAAAQPWRDVSLASTRSSVTRPESPCDASEADARGAACKAAAAPAADDSAEGAGCGCESRGGGGEVGRIENDLEA
ncbi:hypothetical protein AB1Y20_007922 [Prymnesium parvum]|uniref:Uncharacterized protein n=1 Tax=Prymnesium parvum TaxID=97485 RepID=A0AB34ITI9_PRYPA